MQQQSTRLLTKFENTQNILLALNEQIKSQRYSLSQVQFSNAERNKLKKYQEDELMNFFRNN